MGDDSIAAARKELAAGLNFMPWRVVGRRVDSMFETAGAHSRG